MCPSKEGRRIEVREQVAALDVVGGEVEVANGAFPKVPKHSIPPRQGQSGKERGASSDGEVQPENARLTVTGGRREAGEREYTPQEVRV
jgi:hypothetical protein